MVAAEQVLVGLTVQIWRNDIDADMAFHDFRDYACLRLQLSSDSQQDGGDTPS